MDKLEAQIRQAKFLEEILREELQKFKSEAEYLAKENKVLRNKVSMLEALRGEWDGTEPSRLIDDLSIVLFGYSHKVAKARGRNFFSTLWQLESDRQQLAHAAEGYFNDRATMKKWYECWIAQFVKELNANGVDREDLHDSMAGMPNFHKPPKSEVTEIRIPKPLVGPLFPDKWPEIIQSQFVGVISSFCMGGLLLIAIAHYEAGVKSALEGLQ